MLIVDDHVARDEEMRQVARLSHNTLSARSVLMYLAMLHKWLSQSAMACLSMPHPAILDRCSPGGPSLHSFGLSTCSPPAFHLLKRHTNLLSS